MLDAELTSGVHPEAEQFVADTLEAISDIDFLLKRARPKTAVHTSLVNLRISCVQLAVSEGVDIRMTDPVGWTFG